MTVLLRHGLAVIILGAGAIGVEFAYFLNSFGTKVTLVEMKSRVLPIEDEEISDILGKNLAKQGIQILTETSMESVTASASGVKVKLSGKNAKTLLNFYNFFMNLEHHVRQLTLTVFMLIVFRSEATLVQY